jgi:hypothetical protein
MVNNRPAIIPKKAKILTLYPQNEMERFNKNFAFKKGSSRPAFSVKASVLNGLGDVISFYALRSIKIGDGPGHF